MFDWINKNKLCYVIIDYRLLWVCWVDIGEFWFKIFVECIYCYLSICILNSYIVYKDIVVYEMIKLLRNYFDIILIKIKVLFFYLVFIYIDNSFLLGCSYVYVIVYKYGC